MKTFERNENKIKEERDKKRGVVTRLHSGKTVLRVLPPWSEAGVWFRPILSYYFKIDGDHYVLRSPRDEGVKDPIYSYARSLRDSDNPEDMERAKSFFPRRRFYINAVVLSSSDGKSLSDGVQVVELPVKVKEQLIQLDTAVDEGFGDITDLENGFNIVVERTGEGLNTQYNCRPYRERSNILELAKNQGINTDEWELFDLDAVAKPASTEELSEILSRLTGEEQEQPAPSTAPKLKVQRDDKPTPKTEPKVEDSIEPPPF